MKLSVVMCMAVFLWLGSGQGGILPVLRRFCLLAAQVWRSHQTIGLPAASIMGAAPLAGPTATAHGQVYRQALRGAVRAFPTSEETLGYKPMSEYVAASQAGSWLLSLSCPADERVCSQACLGRRLTEVIRVKGM